MNNIKIQNEGNYPFGKVIPFPIQHQQKEVESDSFILLNHRHWFWTAFSWGLMAATLLSIILSNV